MTSDVSGRLPFRAVVLDDHGMFARGLEVLLDDENSPVRLVGWTSDPAELGPLLDRERPDLLIVDVNMPRISGIEVVARLRRAGARIPVVMVSADEEGATVARAIDAGATGYVSKRHQEPVAFALAAAASGFAVLSPATLERLHDAWVDRGGTEVLAHLDDDQVRLWRLLSTGSRSLPEIAEDLHVSTSTLKRMAASLYEVLGVEGRVDAARMAGRHGIVD